MKKLAITIACLLMSVYTYGQGTIQFDTSVAANGMVYDAKTGAAAATDCSAQLFGSKDNTTYVALGTAQSFFGDTEDAGAGFILGPIVTVTGSWKGDTYFVVMKAWRNADPTQVGLSAPLQLTLGGAPADGGLPGLPAGLEGLQGFTIPNVVIPEPSTIALGLVGAAALLLRRRQ